MDVGCPWWTVLCCVMDCFVGSSKGLGLDILAFVAWRLQRQPVMFLVGSQMLHHGGVLSGTLSPVSCLRRYTTEPRRSILTPSAASYLCWQLEIKFSNQTAR